MKKIKAIHKAVSAPMGDLKTYRALPTASLNHIDPFLFLNHHGPQFYKPANQGLPFGPHPHRGFITLTFVLDGDVVHRDSGGGASKIVAGGVQWMTAGRGLIHSEVSSEEFRKEGGQLEILQLWINLPARLKMTEPFYQGLSYADIPHLAEDEGRVQVNVVCGQWKDKESPLKPPFPLQMYSLEFRKGGKFRVKVEDEHNVFLYVVRGQVEINSKLTEALQLAEFEKEGGEIEMIATEDSYLIFGYSPPHNEPIVAYGPFVMNTEKEIQEAYRDFQEGKMG